MATAQYAVDKVKTDEWTGAREKRKQEDKRQYRERHLEDAECQVQQRDVSRVLEIACVASVTVIRVIRIRCTGMMRIVVIVMDMAMRERRLGNTDVTVFIRMHVNATQLQ